MTRRAPPCALVIAGSDSGGGAGIEADLRTLAAHRVHGLCAITAVTAQNTRSVRSIEAMRPRVVAAQLDAVFEDFDVAAVKIGMLATPSIVRAVARALEQKSKIPVVLDPVLVATVGATLAADGLVAALRRHLIERADLLTPNVPEAESLLGAKIRDARDLPDAAAALIDAGTRAVLLKGGHLRGDRVADLFLERGGKPVWFRHSRIGVEGHGTGCTLSSAIAAWLARGDDLADAVAAGIAFVHRGLRGAYRPGRGAVYVLDSFAAPSRR